MEEMWLLECCTFRNATLITQYEPSKIVAFLVHRLVCQGAEIIMYTAKQRRQSFIVEEQRVFGPSAGWRSMYLCYSHG